MSAHPRRQLSSGPHASVVVRLQIVGQGSSSIAGGGFAGFSLVSDRGGFGDCATIATSAEWDAGVLVAPSEHPANRAAPIHSTCTGGKRCAPRLAMATL
jgi:hypothetical protein